MYQKCISFIYIIIFFYTVFFLVFSSYFYLFISISSFFSDLLKPQNYSFTIFFSLTSLSSFILFLFCCCCCCFFLQLTFLSSYPWIFSLVNFLSFFLFSSSMLSFLQIPTLILLFFLNSLQVLSFSFLHFSYIFHLPFLSFYSLSLICLFFFFFLSFTLPNISLKVSQKINVVIILRNLYKTTQAETKENLITPKWFYCLMLYSTFMIRNKDTYLFSNLL